MLECTRCALRSLSPWAATGPEGRFLRVGVEPQDEAGPGADVGRMRRDFERESPRSVCSIRAQLSRVRSHTIPSPSVQWRRRRRSRRSEPTSAFGPAGHHYQRVIVVGRGCFVAVLNGLAPRNDERSNWLGSGLGLLRGQARRGSLRSPQNVRSLAMTVRTYAPVIVILTI